MEIKIQDDTTLELFQNTGHFLSVKIFPEKEMIEYHWTSFAPFETLVEAYLVVGRFLRQHHYTITKGLNDLSQTEGSFDEHNEWMAKVYLPKAIERGYRCTAFVKSADLYAQLALDFFLDNNPEGHTFEVFEDDEEAKKWLEKQ